MKKQFYKDLVKTESLVIKINQLDLMEQEKVHLIALIDSSLHHSILDAVLSELSEGDKKLFLKHLADEEHDEVWKFLNNKVDNIEEKIKKTAEDLTEKLHADIEEAENKKV